MTSERSGRSGSGHAPERREAALGRAESHLSDARRHRLAGRYRLSARSLDAAATELRRAQAEQEYIDRVAALSREDRS